MGLFYELYIKKSKVPPLDAHKKRKAPLKSWPFKLAKCVSFFAKTRLFSVNRIFTEFSIEKSCYFANLTLIHHLKPDQTFWRKKLTHFWSPFFAEYFRRNIEMFRATRSTFYSKTWRTIGQKIITRKSFLKTITL